MERQKKSQTAIGVGIGNSITQNIINIVPMYYMEGSNSISCSNLKDPRSRLQLFTKFDIGDGVIDISLLNKYLKTSNRWIQSAQNPVDFGLPTDDIGSISCTWASAGLLWSSWVISGMTPNWWLKCLRWVLSQSNLDNGIPIVRRMDNSITDATAFALMDASVAGEQFKNAAGDLCDWILDMQNNGGWKWSNQADNYTVISTCLALLSLKVYHSMIGEKGVEIGSALSAGIQFLIFTRNNDLGWGSFPGDISRPANTGFVMYTLSTLGQQAMTNESLDFLQESYRDVIGWNNTVDRPASHNVTRLGVPYSLMGLASLEASEERDILLKCGYDILVSGFREGVYEIPETVARSWPTRDFIFACSTMITN